MQIFQRFLALSHLTNEVALLGFKSRNLFIGLGLSGAVCAIALVAWIWKSNHRSDEFEMKDVNKPVQGMTIRAVLTIWCLKSSFSTQNCLK